jgi:formylglycine-generating enzyme required for sulfatase activity
MNIRRKGFLAGAIFLTLCMVFFGCINDPAGGINPGDGTETGVEADPGSGTNPGTGTNPDVGTNPDIGTDTGTGTDTGQDTVYTVKIDISDDETGDAVTASPSIGIAGAVVTLNYTVANIKHYNLLDFDGVTAAIASVNSAESGTRTYTINAADASNGVITIIAIFTHTDLTPDPIAFTDTGHINKTYGDSFTNAIIKTYKGSGAITYSSSDITVATVNNAGEVTIHKIGDATITAEKAADSVYAHARAEYMLMVAPKPVTITGLSAENKGYDGTTTATVTGTAVIDGKIAGDDLSVVAGTAAFADKDVGNGKTVIFSGYSLTGADAGNYRLTAQPANVTANIENIEFVSMIETVLIPAGTFIMGSPTTETARDSGNNEAQHSVTLTKSFFMGKYLVTQAQYEEVMGAFENRAVEQYGLGDNYPIYNVNWYDAIIFCNKLSVMEGLEPVYFISDSVNSMSGSTNPDDWEDIPKSLANNTNDSWREITWDQDLKMDRSKNGYRLPTEAEWEYACRGDYPNKATETETKPFGIGDGTKMINGMANFGKGSYDQNHSPVQYQEPDGIFLGKTTEVGNYDPNNYGLYDMHGNLREWCWDWYIRDITKYTTDPAGPDKRYLTDGRVSRSGNYSASGANIRSALRVNDYMNNRNTAVGFRVVRSVPVNTQ